MRLGIIMVLCVLTALGFDAGQSMAADLTANVRVALLDMSAVSSRGYAQGWPNTPGTGGQYGYGMMGGGYGMMGGGYGMMGGGMAGMMAIRADQTSVKSGTVSFDVTNWSRSVIHEMVVVSVDSPDAPLPYDYSKLRVPEEQVKIAGDSGELAPNTSKTVKVELTPGSYIIMCNVPGHFAAGMAVGFTVTP